MPKINVFVKSTTIFTNKKSITMKKVNYCTTCKGRLWQLKQTLPENIKMTGHNVSLILLDYHSDDGLEEYILDNYTDHIVSGRLVYYKLETPLDNFDMAYAKHIVHLLSDGDVLFNLDADNYIGSTVNELLSLPMGKMLLPKVPDGYVSRCGRIGVNKDDYLKVGGYDINLHGMVNDDGDFIHRGWLTGLRFIFSEDLSKPVHQTQEQKFIHISDEQYELPNVVTVRDVDNIITTVDVVNNTIVKGV